MINIKKLFKSVGGTQRVKVPASSEHKAYIRTQKKASGRSGTGKLAKFPESIKKEILKLRGIGESGANIKTFIEGMISHNEDTGITTITTLKSRDPITKKKEYTETKVGNLVDKGIINESGKLTVTTQALTSWAKSQGVESTKKRTSAVDAEKIKHESTKKDLEQADQKIADLKVTAKHNLEEIKLVQQSKQESDKIRQNLGKENKNLSEKLKACLGGK